MRGFPHKVEIGDKFHKWTVVAFDVNGKYVRCRCECGHEGRVNKSKLVGGTNRSCPCVRRELKKTHGMSRTRTYRLWQSMHSRVKLNSYYVKKGITVCDRWSGEEGFVNFLADMGECPANKKSLDRYPNPHGNYEPGNCRWADDSEQQRNKTNTKTYEHLGRSQSAAAWAEEFGVPLNTLLGRLDRKWSFERAITTPQGLRRGRGVPQTKDRLIEYKGESKTLAQWAAEFGLNITTMIERVYNEWPMERIEKTPQGIRGGYTKAVDRNRLLKEDASLTVTGAVVLKYATPDELREMLRAVIDAAGPIELEEVMNAVCGGAHPILRVKGCIATKFAVRAHNPAAPV